ncbi:hypothetical protein VTK56DRAFT_579 [Thermocarpiscus australiensis]
MPTLFHSIEPPNSCPSSALPRLYSSFPRLTSVEAILTILGLRLSTSSELDRQKHTMEWDGLCQTKSIILNS